MSMGCIPAFAVDGVVLINQASITAAGGFPFHITQPGSYRLSGDLAVPDGNTTAIKITSDHVTLDLNGFSIIGPTVCTSSPAICPAIAQGFGIQADNGPTVDGPRGIKIFNGTVRGMGSAGIFITGQGALVEKVTADSNGGFGFLVAGSVIESAATRNGSAGIFAIIVRDCIATDNHTQGIQLDASGGTATGNIASFNGDNGISAPNGTVTSNTAVRNVSFGISAVCPSSIVGNTIVSNVLGSITTSGAGCVLVNNATRP
jgi:parallel beta-helix repeat protein